MKQKTVFRYIFFLLLLFAVQQQTKAQVTEPTEQQVRADFLFQFTQFIEWPQDAFHKTNGAFVIGIAGTDSFGVYLQQIVAGQTAAGRPITVRHFTDETEIENCQILFLNKDIVPDTLTMLHSRSIVTVSNRQDFMKNGGMIRFFTEQNKTGFEINLATARAARVEISSKLLRLAKVIEK